MVRRARRMRRPPRAGRRTERDVGGLDGDVGAGPDAMPRSACASAGASLTPSPTTATTSPAACRRCTSASLPSGSTSATTRSMPHLAAIEARSRPGRPSGAPASGRARAAPPPPPAAVGLTRSRDVQPRALACRRRDLDAVRAPADLDLDAVDHARHPHARPVCGTRPRREARRARPRAAAATAGPRGARSPPRRRPRSAGRRRGVAPFQRHAPSASSRPALGDGAGLVEDHRRDRPRLLEHLGALDQDAELGAAPRADHERRRRGEAERARARDDEHGDRRDHAGTQVVGQDRPSPRALRARRRSRAGRRQRRSRSASRWTRALPACASATSRVICASAVSAPTRVARTTSRPYVFTVAPATSSPGSTSTAETRRSASTGRRPRHPRRRRRRSPRVSPGRTTNTSPTASSVHGHEHLVSVAQDARLLRAEAPRARGSAACERRRARVSR